jgi:hypothetical protein
MLSAIVPLTRADQISIAVGPDEVAKVKIGGDPVDNFHPEVVSANETQLTFSNYDGTQTISVFIIHVNETRDNPDKSYRVKWSGTASNGKFIFDLSSDSKVDVVIEPYTGKHGGPVGSPGRTYDISLVADERQWYQVNLAGDPFCLFKWEYTTKEATVGNQTVTQAYALISITDPDGTPEASALLSAGQTYEYGGSAGVGIKLVRLVSPTSAVLEFWSANEIRIFPTKAPTVTTEGGLNITFTPATIECGRDVTLSVTRKKDGSDWTGVLVLSYSNWTQIDQIKISGGRGLIPGGDIPTPGTYIIHTADKAITQTFSVSARAIPVTANMLSAVVGTPVSASLTVPAGVNVSISVYGGNYRDFYVDPAKTSVRFIPLSEGTYTIVATGVDKYGYAYRGEATITVTASPPVIFLRQYWWVFFVFIAFVLLVFLYRKAGPGVGRVTEKDVEGMIRGGI